MMKSIAGWGSGLVGVIIFSASLPATKIAVGDFTPLFLTSARAVIAALVGAGLLLFLREKAPQKDDLLSLAIVAFGVVIGFPLFTALALQHITSTHSIVFIGILPLMTALFGVLRAGEHPQSIFWVFAGIGAVLVATYALLQSADVSLIGDAYMVAAIIACGLGYAEGAKLSKRLGGWQVISWALILSLPVMFIVAVFYAPSSFDTVSLSGWLGLGYVSLFSMMIGFVFWYRGLAIGGIAGVGQLQLLQPFFGFLLAGLLVGEAVEPAMLFVTVMVIGCVIGAKRYA
ncbi:MAG: DMT family transporter [Hyphomicrobiales bacterium]